MGQFLKLLTFTTFIFIGGASRLLAYEEKTLPLLKVSTQRKLPQNKDKVVAQLNSKDHKSAPILIKRRGNSSFHYPKGQFQISFLSKKNHKKKKRSLLGMPKGKNWILNGPYTDRSFIRNALAYKIIHNMGKNSGTRPITWRAPRNQFIELELNGKWQGIYLAMEKIERGKKRIPFPKFRSETSGPEFFILIIQKSKDAFKVGKTYFNYRYPSKSKMEQLKLTSPYRYLNYQDHMDHQLESLQNAFKLKTVRRNLGPLKKIVNLESLIDFILIQELFKNFDGFRRSLHISKVSGGKINFGPFWDFNASMGNVNLLRIHKPRGWLHKHKFPPGFINGVNWFKNVMKNPEFLKLVTLRYNDLRRPGKAFNTFSILNEIEELKEKLPVRSIEKDFALWRGSFSRLNKWGHVSPKMETHKENIIYLQRWLKGRLFWMDKKLKIDATY